MGSIPRSLLPDCGGDMPTLQLVFLALVLPYQDELNLQTMNPNEPIFSYLVWSDILSLQEGNTMLYTGLVPRFPRLTSLPLL